MTLFRFYWTVLGGHTHVRVFAGKGSLSLGLCGELVFRNDEWADFMKEVNAPGTFEFIEDMQ